MTCPNCGKDSLVNVTREDSYTEFHCYECDYHGDGSKSSDSSCQTIRAGPPQCHICKSLMNVWEPKWEPKDKYLWICPNYCNINNYAQEANNSSHTTKNGEEKHE